MLCCKSFARRDDARSKALHILNTKRRGIWEFPNLGEGGGGTFLGGPGKKDYSTSESILGSPAILENYHIKVQAQDLEAA